MTKIITTKQVIASLSSAKQQLIHMEFLNKE